MPLSADSPGNPKIPRHIAIIMDGNGRWATRRHLPRVAGHRAGVDSVRRVVRMCTEMGIEALTLFAFSSENWQRPREEVGLLMNLFMSALRQEAKKLHQHNVRLRVVGDRTPFSTELQKTIGESERMTCTNTGLTLVIAANYGGRWDIEQAVQVVARRVAEGQLRPEEIHSDTIEPYLCLHDLPEPDLFIRTSGEKRISNFLLWQIAYTELYFTDTLWPDFDREDFDAALYSYASRQRRFGQTAEQVNSAPAS
ncbi:MAG: undecaprenyl diphosphate synthase [Candidatus Kentron sp. G]|nr:MAG: Undecaprenyl pyrophosphate synthetase [Candidatus Kentron sp. G]VFM97226.1 MAG: Undecaprenyl pyrophosphate synthetase [Candidatus Kentron sp. G]VFN02077.1 MAG: undecaprenyl diphosphate synthase [Candidatus Kentron sp. G]VFN06363.1 MAG: Undecaprenyl pyrophosphate synthetase [Candidatus Kentron sp. G]